MYIDILGALLSGLLSAALIFKPSSLHVSQVMLSDKRSELS